MHRLLQAQRGLLCMVQRGLLLLGLKEGYTSKRVNTYKSPCLGSKRAVSQRGLLHKSIKVSLGSRRVTPQKGSLHTSLLGLKEG